MKPKLPTDYYSTDTLTLAAWLRSQHYEISGHEKVYVIENGLKTITWFHFKDEKGVRDIAESFRLGKAFGNVNDYEAARRELMRIVKEL